MGLIVANGTQIQRDVMTTDEEIKEFLEMFSDYDIPNPEHYPRCFAYYVKLYKFYKSREQQ